MSQKQDVVTEKALSYDVIMIELPNIFVHKHFAYLLSQNLHSSNRPHQLIAQYITGHRDFHHLVANCFSDIDPQRRAHTIVRGLGWKNFRDRLASVFLYYAHNNRFPRWIDSHEECQEKCQGPIELDQQMLPYTTSGHSRAFLLALYLKLAQAHLNKMGPSSQIMEQKLKSLEIPQAVLALFKKAKSKVVKIDWAILLLWHFADDMGIEQLTKLLDRGTNFKTLQGLLTNEQRDKLYTNLLLYSYGIDDQDFFQAWAF